MILVRSQQSWHKVSAIVSGTRRAINVIFHTPGTVSSMWPPEAPRLSFAQRFYKHIKFIRKGTA